MTNRIIRDVARIPSSSTTTSSPRTATSQPGSSRSSSSRISARAFKSL